MNTAQYIGNKSFNLLDTPPVAPGPGEVRISVSYCGVCGTDLHIFHGAMDHRVAMPQVIGHEMSGIVAEVGEGVENITPGTPVVVRPLDNRVVVPADKGFTHIASNLKFMGIDSPGAFQSSWTVPAFTIHTLPAGIDMQEAAMVEPLAVACHDIRRGRVAAGEHVMVLGGGPIGMLIALVARHAGAHVLLSEVSPNRLALAAELGFDTVNPLESDPIQAIRDRTNGAGADVVFEVSGAAAAVRQMTEVASIRGRIVMVAIHPKPVEVPLFAFFWRELELLGARVYEPEDYDEAIRLVAGRALPLRPLITQVEPLAKIQETFSSLAHNPGAMKVLINCQA